MQDEQPSVATVLLSSHYSEPFTSPSGQIDVQVDGCPKQFHPISLTHVDEHPSPESKSLSSHVSEPLIKPSEQIVEQTEGVPVQIQPVSF